MPKKREIARKSKTVISENLRNYLLKGERVRDVEVFRLSGNPRQFRAVWDAVGKEILRDWIKTKPCTRPYAFWLLAAEKRLKIGGFGDWWGMGMVIDAEGLPKYWQQNWSKRNPPCFESQAAYLDRLGLLTPTEKTYLKKHHELLEPEGIEFDE